MRISRANVRAAIRAPLKWGCGPASATLRLTTASVFSPDIGCGREQDRCPTASFVSGRRQIGEGIARSGYLFYYVEQMKREDALGSLEHIVMLAVMRLGPDAYGMTVRREIENATGRDISIGAVYATLVRLESKGFISSRAGEPTAERGGRAKRYFHATAEGASALHTTHEIILKLSRGLKGLQHT